MRDPVKEHQARESALAEKLRLERERVVNVAAAVFKTPDGMELLEYLCKRFNLHARSFLSADPRGALCPLNAAVRDGQKAVIHHLLELVREDNPKFPIP
jgi:hypothetical protein